MTTIVPSQTRLPLRTAVQASAQPPISTLVCDQFAPAQTASFTVDPEMDEYPIDTSSGSVTATLPLGAKCFPGKAYTFRKKSASNTMTVAFTGGELVEGSATLAATDDNAVIAVKYDPGSSEWVRASPAAFGGAAAGRIALGVNKIYVPLRVATLVGTGVYRTLAPAAGTITAIHSITEGALTTGNATLTGKIGSTAITDGVITVTQAGSAAGDKDSAAPSAANVVASGDEISLTVGGTNATATVANCYFEITLT